MTSYLVLLLLTLTKATCALKHDDHVFDVGISYENPILTSSVVNIANVNKNQIAVAFTKSVHLLNHQDIQLLEDPMNKVWKWSLPDQETNIIAGPVLHSSSKDVYVGDSQYSLYSINMLTGKVNWKKDMDPKITGDRTMKIATSPDGRFVIASAGEQVMAFSVDFGEVLFHRRVGPSFISSEFTFASPPSGQAAASFTAKVIFGDSSGTVHAIHLSSGRKAWSWKFATSSSKIVDLVLFKSGSRGVDAVIVVNTKGDLASIRGDTGTLLWRSHILQSGSNSISNDLIMLSNSGNLLDETTCLFVSNDLSRGALIHSVDIETGTSSIFTLLSSPGSIVNGLRIDETVPSIFITVNSKIKVYNPTNPMTSVNEFQINGFPSTAMQFITGVSEPCFYYVGTTAGTVSYISFETFAEGSACNLGPAETISMDEEELEVKKEVKKEIVKNEVDVEVAIDSNGDQIQNDIEVAGGKFVDPLEM